MLSGGLGSSPYVQDRIKAKYEKRVVPGAEGVEVLVASEPYERDSFAIDDW